MIAIANNSEDGDEAQGGRGEPALTPTRNTAALVRRAIREDWPIKPHVREAVMNQMAIIALNGATHRDKVAAAKTLVAADAVNAKREAMDQADEHVLLKREVIHHHTHEVTEYSNDELLAIIDGRFEEESSGEGTAATPNGDGEPD